MNIQQQRWCVQCSIWGTMLHRAYHYSPELRTPAASYLHEMLDLHWFNSNYLRLFLQASSTESDPRCPVILTSQWSLSYCGLTREQSNYIFYWSLTNLSYQFPREIVDSKRIISRIYKSIPWSWWCILRHQILSTILVDPVWEWENISSPSALQLNLRLLWDWERVGSTGALITHVLTYHWSWLEQWSHWCWCQ